MFAFNPKFSFTVLLTNQFRELCRQDYICNLPTNAMKVAFVVEKTSEEVVLAIAEYPWIWDSAADYISLDGEMVQLFQYWKPFMFHKATNYDFPAQWRRVLGLGFTIDGDVLDQRWTMALIQVLELAQEQMNISNEAESREWNTFSFGNKTCRMDIEMPMVAHDDVLAFVLWLAIGRETWYRIEDHQPLSSSWAQFVTPEEAREASPPGFFGKWAHSTDVRSEKALLEWLTNIPDGEVCVSTFDDSNTIFNPTAVQVVFLGTTSHYFNVDCWSARLPNGLRYPTKPWKHFEHKWEEHWDEGWLVPAEAEILEIILPFSISYKLQRMLQFMRIKWRVKIPLEKEKVTTRNRSQYPLLRARTHEENLHIQNTLTAEGIRYSIFQGSIEVYCKEEELPDFL